MYYRDDSKNILRNGIAGQLMPSLLDPLYSIVVRPFVRDEERPLDWAAVRIPAKLDFDRFRAPKYIEDF